mgnify:FL=1
MNFKITLFAFFFTAFFAEAQVSTRNYYEDEGLVPREQSVDFTHLKLEVSFVPEEKLVIGKVTEDFTVLQKEIDTLFLDAVNIRFKSILLNEKEVRYRIESKGVTILFEKPLNWNSKHQLIISYEANPSKGLYFVGWDDETNRSRKQIWTQGQGIDNRHWIPMYDEKNDKVISEMLIEFDEKYKVLSNGEKLKEKKMSDGKKLWHYKISQPHSTYLIMLGIGEYEIETKKSKSRVPMYFYYYPGEKDHVEPTYRFSVEMFDFFEKEIGVPYPWRSYAQIPVQEFMYGAMENTTATIFGDFYLVNSRSFLDRNYVRVNAHELAHQWFGDMVTARASAHHWLQESFATHYDLMAQEEYFGKEHFDWVRRNYNNQALKASETDFKPLAHSQAGTVRHYPKGAFVLQMLKYVVGREQFNAGIKHYLEKHAYGNVDSDNLLTAFHERLGLSLNWFWEEWIKKGGEPHYQVELIELPKSVTFFVKQVHERNNLVGLFKMPIDFEVHFKDGSNSTKKVWIENESHLVNFDIPEGKEIDYVLFDPNAEVMKKVTFKKSLSMLLAQAEKANNLLDRYDAVEALMATDFPEKDAFMKEIYSSEEFHAIKSLIIANYVPLMNDMAKELIQQAVKEDTTEVKMTLLESTVRISDELEPFYVQLLKDSSYNVIEKALDLLTFYRPAETEKYLELTKNVIGNRSHNVRIKWLEVAYSISQDEKVLNELVDYTSNSFEFLTRVNAAKALKRLNIVNEKALSYLFDASFSFKSRLRTPVKEVIDHFFEQRAYKTMIINFVVSEKWSDTEFKRVNKYLIY